jgi:hypothetical protein
VSQPPTHQQERWSNTIQQLAATQRTLDAQMATLRAIVASLADPNTEPEVKQ